MQHEFIFNYKNNNNNVVVVKQFLLPDISLVNEYNECYKYIINEACMQYYAYILNSLRPLSPNEVEHMVVNMVVIPKLFGIDIINNISGCYISIYMEYVNRIENPAWVPLKGETSISDNDYGFDLWDPIIKNVFNYFEEHNLYHHDSGYRNVFWIDDYTDNNNRIKLAIIDYGEALLANNRTEIPISQLSGYHSLANKEYYLLWLSKQRGVGIVSEGDHIYGGVNTKSKIKKSKTKKSKKSKKSKTKKSKTKKSKTKKSKK